MEFDLFWYAKSLFLSVKKKTLLEIEITGGKPESDNFEVLYFCIIYVSN